MSERSLSRRTARAQPGARLRRASFGILIGLLLEFAMGMVANLFVAIPGDHPGAHPDALVSGSLQSFVWAVTQGQLGLALHAVLGFLLVFGGIAFVVQALPLGRRNLLLAAALGALSILGAALSGLAFPDFDAESSSMRMALFFALATLSYAVVLLLVPPEP